MHRRFSFWDVFFGRDVFVEGFPFLEKFLTEGRFLGRWTSRDILNISISDCGVAGLKLKTPSFWILIKSLTKAGVNWPLCNYHSITSKGFCKLLIFAYKVKWLFIRIMSWSKMRIASCTPCPISKEKQTPDSLQGKLLSVWESERVLVMMSFEYMYRSVGVVILY